MDEDPVAELEQLLADGVDDEVQLWASRDFPDGTSTEDVTAAREQCRRLYEKAVAAVSEAWGKHDFRGALAADEGELVIPDGFPWPLCEFANEVTSWQRDGWVACVWWEQQDPAVPFSVWVGVTEPAE